MHSQLRHFIAQQYIYPPLLLSSHEKRKFHIRSYVLAVGALSTCVYEDMHALFAPLPYTAPGVSSSTACAAALYSPVDPRVQLTNNCLQDGSREGSVVRFWIWQKMQPTYRITGRMTFLSTYVGQRARSSKLRRGSRWLIWKCI